MREGIEAEAVKPLFLLTGVSRCVSTGRTLLDSSEGVGEEEAGDRLFNRLNGNEVDGGDDEATESPGFGLDDPPCNEKTDRRSAVEVVDLDSKTAVHVELDEPRPDDGPGAGTEKAESRGGVFGRWGLLPAILAASDFSSFDCADHKPKGALGEAG
jgi:hypothetical protein